MRYIAEQLRFDQGFRDGATVHCDKGPTAPVRVNRLRKQLFARSAFSMQQYGQINRGGATPESDGSLDTPAASIYIFEFEQTFG